MSGTRESAGDFSQSVTAHVLYLSCVAALICVIPPGVLSDLDRGAILAVGILGTWRYSWNLLHFARALVYQKWVFPQMRERASRLARETEAPHAFFLITSFRISTDTSVRVYRAVFEAALAHPGRSTIIASLVEMGDQRLVKSLFLDMVGADHDRINLTLTRIGGTGKRDALAFGFRAISASKPGPAENDIVMVIDGDSIVPADIVERCAPIMLLDPNVGALTTDEISEVQSGGKRIFHHWYSLRFAQRQILMSSMGLSKRVLTLTGRMSMFRAPLVCDPSFIRQIESDRIEHWRIGQYSLLTGDDKSSWFWLLSRGYQMLYVPDVVVRTVEELPDPRFFTTSITLMKRWFGNMLRTNDRAIAVGPSKIGFFTWWCIIDQRLSMWTSLTGIIFAVLSAISVSTWALAIYAAWILVSRYMLSLLLLSQRNEMSVWYPLLLWYNQVVGSLVKTYALSHPSQQKWTRQKTTLAKNAGTFRERYIALSSNVSHAVMLAALITVIAVWTRTLSFPSGVAF